MEPSARPGPHKTPRRRAPLSTPGSAPRRALPLVEPRSFTLDSALAQRIVDGRIPDQRRRQHGHRAAPGIARAWCRTEAAADLGRFDVRNGHVLVVDLRCAALQCSGLVICAMSASSRTCRPAQMLLLLSRPALGSPTHEYPADDAQAVLGSARAPPLLCGVGDTLAPKTGLLVQTISPKCAVADYRSAHAS